MSFEPIDLALCVSGAKVSLKPGVTIDTSILAITSPPEPKDDEEPVPPIIGTVFAGIDRHGRVGVDFSGAAAIIDASLIALVEEAPATTKPAGNSINSRLTEIEARLAAAEAKLSVL